MKKPTLYEIREKYLEYKGILEKIELGDQLMLEQTTVFKYEMMRKIVDALDDIGFELITRKLN